jgi:hypothetical protein
MGIISLANECEYLQRLKYNSLSLGSLVVFLLVKKLSFHRIHLSLFTISTRIFLVDVSIRVFFVIVIGFLSLITDEENIGMLAAAFLFFASVLFQHSSWGILCNSG